MTDFERLYGWLQLQAKSYKEKKLDGIVKSIDRVDGIHVDSIDKVAEILGWEIKEELVYDGAGMYHYVVFDDVKFYDYRRIKDEAEESVDEG